MLQHVRISYSPAVSACLLVPLSTFLSTRKKTNAFTRQISNSLVHLQSHKHCQSLPLRHLAPLIWTHGPVVPASLYSALLQLEKKLIPFPQKTQRWNFCDYSNKKLLSPRYTKIANTVIALLTSYMNIIWAQKGFFCFLQNCNSVGIKERCNSLKTKKRKKRKKKPWIRSQPRHQAPITNVHSK